jgi:hypothetical protein
MRAILNVPSDITSSAGYHTDGDDTLGFCPLFGKQCESLPELPVLPFSI